MHRRDKPTAQHKHKHKHRHKHKHKHKHINDRSKLRIDEGDATVGGVLSLHAVSGGGYNYLTLFLGTDHGAVTCDPVLAASVPNTVSWVCGVAEAL